MARTRERVDGALVPRRRSTMAEALVAWGRHTPVETHFEGRHRYDHRKLAVEDGVDTSDESERMRTSDSSTSVGWAGISKVDRAH